MKEATFAKHKSDGSFLYLIKWDEVAAVIKNGTTVKVVFNSGRAEELEFDTDKEPNNFMDMFNAYLSR